LFFICSVFFAHFFFLSLLRPPPYSPLFPYTTLFRSRDLVLARSGAVVLHHRAGRGVRVPRGRVELRELRVGDDPGHRRDRDHPRSEEHTSELQSRFDLVCRLLLEKKKKQEQ